MNSMMPMLVIGGLAWFFLLGPGKSMLSGTTTTTGTGTPGSGTGTNTGTSTGTTPATNTRPTTMAAVHDRMATVAGSISQNPDAWGLLWGTVTGLQPIAGILVMGNNDSSPVPLSVWWPKLLDYTRQGATVGMSGMRGLGGWAV